MSAKTIKPKKWEKEDEELMKTHILEMRVRLAKFSSTAPWKKVMMGAMDHLKKDEDQLNDSEISPRELQKLPYEEYARYISTLASINQCVDRKYLNDCLKKMSSEEVEVIKTEVVNK